MPPRSTRRVTLADVASLSGFSTSAVSLVLNDRPARLTSDARARIRAAAAELGYVPDPAARSLRTGKTSTVAFISDDVTVTRYASAMIRGVLDEAHRQGQVVLIAETGGDSEQIDSLTDAMLHRRVDGVLIALRTGKQIDVPDVGGQVPVVLLNATASSLGAEPIACVLPEERVAGTAVTKLLTDAGHRKIAVLGYSEELLDPRNSATVGDRYAGIFQALDAAGIEPVWSSPDRDWSPDVGYRRAQELFKSGVDATAVVCLNDPMAWGLYQAAAERGVSIPKDLSVVSFDDDEMARYLRPGLTTAAIPYQEIGRRGLELLLAGEPQGTELIEMPLRIRQSVAPPR